MAMIEGRFDSLPSLIKIFLISAEAKKRLSTFIKNITYG